MIRISEYISKKNNNGEKAWLEVVPAKTVAWDYGTLREVSDES